MLNLRPMQPDEFSQYLAQEIESSAREIAESEDLELEQARQEAREEITSHLPDGLETEGTYFYFVDHVDGVSTQTIGTVRFSIFESEKYAWLDSIEIDPAFQGQGFGRQLMALIEAELSTHGVQTMTLHVADTNSAFQFYQKCGYHTAAYNLLKRLKTPVVVQNFRLRPLDDVEVEAVLQHEIERIAQAYEAVYGLPRPQAVGVAGLQVRGRLQDGRQTPGHYLCAVESAEAEYDARLGHVWFWISPDGQSARIESIAMTDAITEAQSGPARTTQAFLCVDAELFGRGVHTIKSYLVGNDAQLLELYLSHGFVLTGRHMTKRWSG